MKQTFRVNFDKQEDIIGSDELVKVMKERVNYPIETRTDPTPFSVLVTIFDPSGDGQDELTDKLDEAGINCMVDEEVHMLINEEDIDAFVREHGMTDKEMKSVLSDMGFKGLSNKLTLAEVASGEDYIWSFRYKRWFNKNGDYTEGQELFIEDIHDEPEHK
jgi:hypothetical protein